MKWGSTQSLYYRHNVLLQNYRISSERIWMTKTVGSLIDLSLGMWNVRCDLLHGADESETKIKKKAKLLIKV